MSAWILGLALSAGYLMNKKLHVNAGLHDAIAKFNSAALPADSNGATTAEVRKAWANTDGARMGDVADDLNASQRLDLEQKMAQQQQEVDAFDGSAAQIQGVMLNFDQGGF